jgi:hypothetical protein
MDGGNFRKYEDGSLLGCSAMSSGRSLSTFQRSLLLHGTTTQNIAIFVLTAMRTSNPVKEKFF